MNGVCDELDGMRAELEKLKEECRSKTKLIDSLRTAHNEQKSKLQGAMVQIEELARELHVKSEEIPELKQLYEDLKAKAHEKDSLLRHLNCANEKLRVDYGARFLKLEAENKELVAALDEATERIQDLELKDRSRTEELEGLKRLLFNKQKKFTESDQEAMESKKVKQREDMILKLEEENRLVEEKLKWKNEQFAHLEDAHRKLQEQFRSCKVDWKRERSALVEEISSLQTSLDSQTRISETLQTRLKMCNQALSHEESRRKILEVEVSELKSHFESAFSSSHETKTNSDHLTLKRDEDIANLRNLIGTKEINSKEMEHRIVQLEQEKQGLKESFKESQISNAELTLLLKKLEYKIQDLELLHENTSMNLQKKEDQHSTQMEKLKEVVDGYKSKLKNKNKKLQELQNDLEGYSCLLEVQSEEVSIVMMIMKSEYSAAYLKLFDEKTGIELHNKESEEKVLLLTKQLEMKDSALNSLYQKLKQKNEEATSLAEKAKKLEYKIQDLEQLHENTSMNLQKKEDQHSTQMEKLTEVIEGYKSKLKGKDKKLQELQNDLEGYSCLLEVQSEEVSIVMMIMKSEYSAAYLKLFDEKTGIELHNKESEEKVLLLTKQLEMKDSALNSLYQKLKQKNEEATSLAEKAKKLEYKIQDLEQLHENTSMNLQKKEDQHSTQMEKLTEVIEGYKSKLKGKDKKLQELQNDLEGCNCLLEVQSEEDSIVMMIMKSEYSAAYIKLVDEKTEKELHNKESEEKVLLLTKQLDMKDSSLNSLYQKLEQKHEEAIALAEKAKSYDCMKQQYSFMEEELLRHKKMLAESSENQNFLKKQVLNMESELKMHNHESLSAIEKANAELAKKISEASNVEVELQKWKSVAENLELCLRESQETSCAESKSLKSSVKEQDEQICTLQKTIASLESRYADKVDALEALEAEKEHSIRTAEDNCSTIEKLQNEIMCLTQNFDAREEEIVQTKADAEKAFKKEKNRLLRIIKDKDQIVEHFSEKAKLTEQHCTNTLVYLVDYQIKVDMLSEALDEAGNLKKAKIEEKEKIITALKMKIKNLHEKLENQEENLLQMKQKEEQLEDLLQANNCELIKAKYQSSFEQKYLENLVKDLELQKGALVEDITKLSTDRDDLLTQLDQFLEQVDEFSRKDFELVSKLENMSHNFEEEKGNQPEILADNGLSNSASNIVKQLHISEVVTGGTTGQRFPLTEINS
ncbi:uncharacterized protein LOC141687365 [Apium graveolens]|uniref:uncharacterized protein LOC141687365 n=1 Tax=Apium graveolens TaxID=4045 RepID=UPI003D7A52F6